jgi:hypothetical protein
VAAVPPASGAVVMGTGIVAIGLGLDGQALISHAILAIAGLAWVLLGLLLGGRVLLRRERVRSEARSPAALTGVAGTAVLGTGLTLLGWVGAGEVLLGLTLCLWLVLLGPVLRNWATPTVGASFVLVVSTESLPVLASTVAVATGAVWLAWAAAIPWGLGLAAYVFVLSRFDLRQIASGRGDHWVAGGALAISALATGRLALAAQALGANRGLTDNLGYAALAVWLAAMAWLPALLLGELRWPRLAYDVRRWSTVFPVGMYAACSFITGHAAHLPPLLAFAKFWVWFGLVVWGVVLGAMLRRGVGLAGGARGGR